MDGERTTSLGRRVPCINNVNGEESSAKFIVSSRVLLNFIVLSMTLSSIDEGYLRSVEIIAFLQNRFSSYERLIVESSVVGDNRQMFLVFFPLVAGFSNVLGIRTLWAAVISEWLNLILKWIFKGDRPFWWIPQNAALTKSISGNLRQFPNTCESGPGTPSGHLMINVAVFYVVARGICHQYIQRSTRYDYVKFMLSSIVYMLYAAWVTLIFISRMYIQTHFLHQCIFGVVFGLSVGHLCWSLPWLVRGRNPLSGSLFSAFLLCSSVAVYILLLQHGLNPLWPIPLALKYCADTSFVHIDTQPYFIMVRFTAVALSVGMALSVNRKYINNIGVLRGFFIALLGIASGKAIQAIQLQLPQDIVIFLPVNFILFFTYTYLVLNGIPYLLTRKFLRSR